MSKRPDRDLHRFLVELARQVRPMRERARILRTGLRAVVGHFEAEAGAVAVRHRGARRAAVEFTLPPGAAFDLDLLDAFIRLERPELPPGLLLAPVRRRDLPWGVLALTRPSGFAPGEGRDLALATAVLSERLADSDRERMHEVRARIDRKLMEELRPKDLFYQVLHGLRSLTHYDHSSALLAAEGGELNVVAEQIAWRKGKSDKIGHRLPLEDGARRLLAAGGVFRFDRREGRWTGGRGGEEAAPLVRLLDYNRGAGDGPAEGAILCAPLVTDEGLFGVLKVAAGESGTFGPWDEASLAAFVPHAAIAIRNARRTVTLEARMLAAERKHVMADLVRGVAHDVNNALGSVVPLVQQLRADAAEGPVDPKVLADDLAQIDISLRVCRRIFGGMLAFARGAGRRLGPADLRAAVRNALAILQDGMARRGVVVLLRLAEPLPALRAAQSDVEQLLLNLLTNARDAMPDGGRVTVDAVVEPGAVILAIEDTGAGIPEELQARILEPFFTTKPDGNGLGLSICRSIAWELGGDLVLTSRPGQGTRVVVRLPLAAGERCP